MALEEREAIFIEETAAAAEEALRLHPGLADIYRSSVGRSAEVR